MNEQNKQDLEAINRNLQRFQDEFMVAIDRFKADNM